MQVIQHVELSSNTVSITFSSIPQTYTDLVVLFSLRLSQSNDYIRLELNGSPTSISSRSLQGNGTSATSYSTGANLYNGGVVPSNHTASTFSNGTLYLPNYTSSANKSFSIDTVSENNATSALSDIHAGLRSNTEAITSLTISAPDIFMNFLAQYSSATLYGIKSGSDGIVTVT
jgi:hypothetical protein